MIQTLSLRLARSWAYNGGLPQERVPVIAYGLQIILGLLVKLFWFLIIPSLLGVLPQTIAALTASALFRLPAGGAHCTSFGRCLLGSLTAFSLIGILAKNTIGLGWTMTFFYTVIGFSLIVTFLLVPVDNLSKPVKKPQERLRMKQWAGGVLLSYIMAVNILNFRSDLIFAASLGLLLQVFTLLSLGSKLMHSLDELLITCFALLQRKRGET